MADIELVQVVRVIALDEEATEPEAGQYLLVDTADGTKKMQVNNLLQAASLSDDAKTALLDCFAHCAWVDEHGQTYYDNLYDALYPDPGLDHITAVFEQGSYVVYPNTPLNDLKPYLTVTGYYQDGSTARIVDYSLSGTLTVGTSTVTVTYGDKTTTFNVTVSSYPAAYLTMNDVDTVIGYRNPVIQNGSVSCDVESTKTFSVFAIKPASMPVKYNSHLLMPVGGDPGSAYTFFVFKKDGNDFYVTDGGSEYKFTYNSGGYYDAQSVQGVTQKSISGSFIGECVASIENGVLTITSTDGDGRATFTNANIFGYWGSAFYVVLVDNCEVNYNDSI